MSLSFLFRLRLYYFSSFFLFFSLSRHTHKISVDVIMLNLLQNEKLFNSQIYELLFFFLSLSLLSQFIHCENSFRCTFSLHTKIFFLSFSLALDFSNLLHRLHFISFYIFCCFQLFLLENFHFLFDFLLFFLIFFSLSAARSFH